MMMETEPNYTTDGNNDRLQKHLQSKEQLTQRLKSLSTIEMLDFIKAINCVDSNGRRIKSFKNKNEAIGSAFIELKFITDILPERYESLQETLQAFSDYILYDINHECKWLNDFQTNGNTTHPNLRQIYAHNKIALLRHMLESLDIVRVIQILNLANLNLHDFLAHRDVAIAESEGRESLVRIHTKEYRELMKVLKHSVITALKFKNELDRNARKTIPGLARSVFYPKTSPHLPYEMLRYISDRDYELISEFIKNSIGSIRDIYTDGIKMSDNYRAIIKDLLHNFEEIDGIIDHQYKDDEDLELCQLTRTLVDSAILQAVDILK